MGELLLLFFLITPIISFIIFIVSLILFIRAKKKPNQISYTKMLTYRTLFIVSGIITALCVTVIIAFMMLMAIAVSNM